MAVKVIPIDGTLGKQAFGLVLDGEEFTFELLNNTRANRWTLNVYAADGDLLAAGVRMVANWPLLMRNTDPRLPPGTLFLLDQSGANSEADFEALGTTHALLYKEA